VQKRSLRWSEGLCVLEGPDLVSAALDAGADLEAIYVDEFIAGDVDILRLVQQARDNAVPVFSLEEGVLASITDAVTPQPIVGTFRFSPAPVSELPVAGFTIICHELRDPGNAGTIIRSADAAGAAAVVFTGDSVDPFHPKTLRATAGSIFHLPVTIAAIDDVLAFYEASGVKTLATVVTGGTSHRDENLTIPVAMLIGSESHGLPDDIVARCAGAVTIPMAGRNESLNAGVAAALVAFESFYQRQDAISKE
jgi:TrmH family RNA methyltransferase